MRPKVDFSCSTCKETLCCLGPLLITSYVDDTNSYVLGNNTAEVLVE